MHVLKKKWGSMQQVLVSLFLSALLFHVMKSGGSAFGGTLLLAVLGWIVGGWWQHVFARTLRYKKDWSTRLLGAGAFLLLWGLLSSIGIVWYLGTSEVISGALVLTILASFFLYKWSKKILAAKSDKGKPALGIERKTLFCFPHILLLMYIVLCAVIWFLMKQSTGTGIMHTPWDALHSAVLPLTFVSLVLLGLLLCSRYKTPLLLALITLQSIVMHAYVPLSHEMPYGGDVWRMIGVEERLASGVAQLPVLIGENVEYRDVGPFHIPTVLTKPHKYVYGQLWGISLAVHYSTGLNLTILNIWLVPVLWSLLMPLLFYRLGRLLFRSPRYGLWMSGLALLPYSFQALGALTLATSLGLIQFFFTALLWFSGMRSGHKIPQILSVVLSALMIFGYPLYFLCMWLLIGATGIRAFISTFRGKGQCIAWGIFSLLAVGVFPVLELLSGVNQMPTRIDWFTGIKQFVGQFSGWFFASLIRPHDILPGNVLFNHTPQLAAVDSVFFTWRWHMMAAMALMGTACLYALFQYVKREKSSLWHVHFIFIMAIGGGYVISWYLLEGDRSFTRRMDPLLAYLGIVCLLYALAAFLKRWRIVLSRPVVRGGLIALSFLLAWVGTTAYASGPDMRVISTDEYRAAELLWNDGNAPPCVLGDTWMLLALEGISGADIEAGGFPLGHQYAQPERLGLLEEIYIQPSSSTIARIDTFAPEGKVCDVALETDRLDPAALPVLIEALGSEPTPVGNMLLWTGRNEALNLQKE